MRSQACGGSALEPLPDGKIRPPPLKKKFNLTYWSADFHGDNADCTGGGGGRGWVRLSFIWLTLPASDGKKWAERECEHSFKQRNHLVKQSPSNRNLHLYFAEMRLDSILQSIWFRREGTWVPISRPLVGNVYHLPATGAYGPCGSIISRLGVRHKQLMVGRW